jgi:hypothetical protein
MKQLMKTMIAGLLLIVAVASKSGETAAAPGPMTVESVLVSAATLTLASSSVNGAPPAVPTTSDWWCWFCERYEGHAVHPISEEWEEVVYAYCADWGIAGGGDDCEEPLNGWVWNGEGYDWVGDTCVLTPYGAPTEFFQQCDCMYEPLLPWPDTPLTIDNCFLPTPVQAIAGDGFLKGVQRLAHNEMVEEHSEKTCTGIVSAYDFSDMTGAVTKSLSRLVL